MWDTAKLGKLTSVESGISKTTYTYDAAGRIATSIQRTDSVDYDFVYRYHKGWGLKQVQYPSDRWVRYTPDAADRTVKIERLTIAESFDKNYWSGVQYAPQGVPRQITLGNGLTERWAFNTTRQQPWQIKIGTAANDSDRGRWEFDYCNGFNSGSCSANNGNIVGHWNYAPNRIQNYSYDPLSRLASASEGGTGAWSQTYSYDRYGNRWVTAAGLATDPRTPDSSSDINPANNRLTGENYAYDLAGNQTTYGGWALSNDAENRVKTSQQSGGYETAYVYDGDGRRVKKTTDGESTWFAYDAMGNLAAEYKATPPSGPALTHFITTDHLGSTRLVTDENGNVYSRHDYLPYGEEIFAGTGGRTVAMKYVPNDLLTHRFTGKERDAETGLDYFGARYFSGVQGRWASADAPFADQFVDEPQSWNLHSYVTNSPLSFVDEDGRGKAKAILVVLRRLNIGDTVRVVRHNKPNTKLSPAEARDRLLKGGNVEFAGKKGADRAAGANRIEHGPHQSVPADQRQPHNHPGAQKPKGRVSKMKGHAFYAGGVLVIPGSTFGTDLFGNNLFGYGVDFFNPIGDVEDTFNLFDQIIVPTTFGFADDFLMKPRPDREDQRQPVRDDVWSKICFNPEDGCEQ